MGIFELPSADASLCLRVQDRQRVLGEPRSQWCNDGQFEATIRGPCSITSGRWRKFSAGKFHFEPPFTSFDHLVGSGEQRRRHHGTADCCIRPPGRNEMIAITPPKIFPQGGGPKQATPRRWPKTGHPTYRASNLPHHQKSVYAKFPGMRPG